MRFVRHVNDLNVGDHVITHRNILYTVKGKNVWCVTVENLHGVELTWNLKESFYGRAKIVDEEEYMQYLLEA